MKLIKGKNANRGFTLTELIVVMGLSIVVLTLMLTMLTIFTNKVSQNKAYQGFYDEVAMCRNEIQEFLADADFQNSSVTVLNNEKDSILRYKDAGSNSKEFKLYGHVMSSSYNTKDVYFDYINKIKFDVLDEDGDQTNDKSGCILKCTIIGSYVAGKEKYKDANGKERTRDIIAEVSQTMLFSLESSNAKFVIPKGGSK